MEFNEKLKQLRKDRNLTQEQLAEKLYVSRTAISKWESGRGYPSIDSLKEIARFFSMSVDELLSTEELITLAETDSRSKTNSLYNIVFGILDCMIICILFLPMFSYRVDGYIYSVPLIELKDALPYIVIPYYIFVTLSVTYGILLLILQGRKSDGIFAKRLIISLSLSAVGTLGFISTGESYAATLLFFMLIIKSSILINRR